MLRSAPAWHDFTCSFRGAPVMPWARFLDSSSEIRGRRLTPDVLKPGQLTSRYLRVTGNLVQEPAVAWARFPDRLRDGTAQPQSSRRPSYRQLPSSKRLPKCDPIAA